MLEIVDIIMKWDINRFLPAISDTELETKFELVYERD
jgi:hypothetical protein